MAAVEVMAPSDLICSSKLDPHLIQNLSSIS
uniref:Uncharacterized protein n=1 Tax=Arundo donax TaxID=35708 RepID=A0A0A9FEV4_ARUDO